MADTIRKLSYYYVMAEDEPGAGARMLSALRERGVNLIAFHGFPEGGRAQLDFVPENETKFLEAARDAGLELSEGKTVFCVQGDDRPGACATLLKSLADADINVTATDAVAAGGGRYGALIWVDPENVDAAAEALGAEG